MGQLSFVVWEIKQKDLIEMSADRGKFICQSQSLNLFIEGVNAAKLTALLTYHVVSGKFEATAVIEAITKNNGKFTVTTVQGGKIDLTLKDGKVILTDAKGGMSTVILADVAASNGVIHAIDSVVMPK